MSNTVLLASASVIIFSVATYAESGLKTQFESGINVGTRASSLKGLSELKDLKELMLDLPNQDVSQNQESQKLPADLIVDFAKFSYSVDKKAGWSEGDKTIYNKLINDGWILDAFDGTTGTANNQVESVSGLLAFKDDQVVIATRGTEMTNWYDWMTNFRFSRSPITRFFAADEANKASAITAQFFGGVDGEVANGFLQTHLSSWDYIKEAILKRAQTLGKSTKDLQYTITGHNKGAAKAQLNALNLLTDSTLAIGVDYLEKSFIGSNSTMEELGMSGFYGMGIKSEPENKGNVDITVFESPRVFSDTTAEQVNGIFGIGNLVRVENKSKDGIDSDPVIHLTPAFMGFGHAGTAIDVDAGFFVGRHMMGNVGAQAIDAIEKHRETVAQKALETEESAPASPSATATTPATEVESDYFGKSVVEAVKSVWNYFWG
jgi:hypothetical protein